MRSKLKVLVAVFLMAAMVFTMFPASAIAGPKGKGNRKPGVTVEETQAPETEVVETEAPTEEVETETVIETEAVTEAPVVETEAPAEVVYSAKTLEGTEGDISVKVEAPEGALPDGTEMVLTTLTPEEFAAVEEKVDGNVVEAIDIAFWNNDEEIEPLIPIVVTMSSAKIAEAEDTTVVHIADETGEATPVEQLEEPVAAANEVVFEADSFSVYAVVWKDADNVERSATIHWGTYNDEVFEELESPTTLDTTASSVKLDVIIDGYYFVGAVYKATESAEGVNLSSTTLKKAADGTWQVTLEGSGATTIADGSHIYVNYASKSDGQYVPPSPPTEGVLAPETDKTVTDNGDGTFTIQLDIEGKEDETITQIGANVVVVMDITQSMTNTMPNSTRTRMAAAKSALNTLITTLNPDVNLINFTAVNFAISRNGATLARDWTTQTSQMTAYVDGLPNNPTERGTNWKAGLQGGIERVNNAKGSSTLNKNETYVIFVTDGNPNCYMGTNNDWHGSTGPGFNQQAYNAAVTYANQLGGSSHFYGVFVGDDDGYDHLDDLISNANGVGTIEGTNEEDLKEEFGKIAQTIIDNLGAGSVVVDDGIPTLSNVSANVSAGEAGGFEYYITPKNGTQSEWTDAPGASYSNSNGVTWNLSEAGTLKDGWIYTLKFTVWPSQAAYDLIADLNNGKINYSDLTEEQKASVQGSKETGYTLMTNTHLYTTFKDLDGNEYMEENDASAKAMPLPTKTISVKKIWPDNALDSYGAATYRDENGNVKTATEITLNLQKDKADYLPVTVKAEEGWQKGDIYVSCGNMSIKDGNVTIHEPGHDYQIVEPEAFSYYWDLISDVYHPMVINGTATLLVLDEKATSADNVNTFEINGKFYTKHADTENTLEAYNYRRSNLNLTKVVSTIGAKADDYFTYTATVKDANSTDGKVWFSAWDPEASATVKDTDWVISGATAQEGNTGYWIADNGATVTFRIKAGWNVRFLNLFHGSTFSFEETVMPNFYEFENAEAENQYDFMDEDITEDDWQTITDKKVEGTIVEPNNSYTVTYTNKFEAFYVYHSGVAVDGNLEVVGMPETGKYDLTQNITKDTLYGGYYLDYAGKGDYKDDGVKGTTGVAYTGMNYNWSGAQTVKGTEITPVAGETYYIKEVPTYYLRNYYQINYMKTSGELKALYLISAVDDLNYKETGFELVSEENKVKAKVVSQMTFKNYSTGKSVTLKANTVFRKLDGKTAITQEGEYLTYYDATSSEYFKVGEFSVLPYWITPDDITINGISTRTITITELTKSGITKEDN